MDASIAGMVTTEGAMSVIEYITLGLVMVPWSLVFGYVGFVWGVSSRRRATLKRERQARGE